ncbi:MAG: peptide chain release factor N(5)-glutamine methyltransferase [bacterium]
MSITWKQAIADASNSLSQHGISDAKSNADFLALHILGLWNRSELNPFLENSIRAEELAEFDKLMQRRCLHEPLQHIIGETEFYGLRLFTSPSALIPRPETEILVEEAIRECHELLTREIRILDIGTGSGAIALALASSNKNFDVLGIDVSENALALAEKNKVRVGLRNLTFEQKDIFSQGFPFDCSTPFDLIVSNPPYIPATDILTLELDVRDFEPHIALTDKGDGLLFYRRIVELSKQLLTHDGKIVVEIGFGQTSEVIKIFLSGGLTILRVVKDLQGIERVIVASCAY